MRVTLMAALLATTVAHARTTTNAAQRRPYLLWSPPVSGSDTYGPEEFVGCRTWYRGQLTDGLIGVADHRRANEWVRFPQSCGPVCIIDLGCRREVLGVAVHALGGGPRNLAFPTAIRVEAFDSFPPPNERESLGTSTFTFPHTKGKGTLSIKRLEVHTESHEARFVRVEVNGRRNAGLWVAEIEVLTDERAVTAISAPPPLPKNVALGASYSASAKPYDKYPDRDGRELTDGALAGAFERHSAWSAWSRRVEVNVELSQAERVSSAEFGALGGKKWGVDFPSRIELYALDAEAQGRVWLRLGVVHGGGVPKELEGRFAIRRYSLSFAPIQASRYRLVATGKMIFLDEIVLGAAGAEAATSDRPCGAMCEAEDCAGAEVLADEAAVGAKASRLEQGGKLTFEAALAPGDYVIRVRAKPTEPDVFSAAILSVNGHELEPLCITMPMFTRQRRYFRLAKPGAQIELTLSEGPPAIVDRFRIEPAFETARIKELKPPCLETTLVREREPAARIVIPKDGRFTRQADRLSAVINKLTGVSLPMVGDVDVKRADYSRYAHVVMGTYLNNQQVWPLAPNSWGRPPVPKPGQFALITYHNPMGLGRNAIALLANEDEGMDKALTALEARLTPGATLRVPHLHIPERTELTEERKRESVVEAGKWTRQHLRSFLTRWKRYGPEGFRLLAYRFFECLDSKDTVRVDLYHDGFADAELQKLICCWDRWEEDPCFSDLERLAITNVLYDVARFCQFPYGRYLWGLRGNREPEVLLDFARRQEPRLRWNHQTFPAYSLLTAGQYFGTYYSLPEAPIWLELARIGFEPMREAAKPGEDCWGYQDITMIHALRYFAAVGDEEYLNSGVQEKFLRLRLLSMDNSASGVSHGDSSPYRPPLAPGWERRDDTHRSFLSTYWRPDWKKIDFESTLGVYVHPVDRLFAERFGAPVDRPLFDKICFRTKVAEDRHYLLLDGVSRSHHGHWDGNSILRFYDNGRCFLVEGDYLNGDLKDHNTLTFARDAVSAYPPHFSHLAGTVDSEDVGMTRSVTPDYNGSTWTRNIIWTKDRYFVVLDELQANQGGTFDAQVRWRTLGKISRTGQRVTSEQAGGQVFHLVNADGARILLRDDARDGNKNWKRYPHAEPVTRLIGHRFVGNIPASSRHAFQNLFYVAGPDEEHHFDLRPIGKQCALVTGAEVALVGTGSYLRGAVNLSAGLYYLSEQTVVACGCRSIELGDARLGEALPADLSIDLSAGFREIVADHLRALERSAKPAEAVKLEPPKERGIDEVWSHSCTAEITALRVADLDGDGRTEILVGCADGALAALDQSGGTLWSRALGHRVNHISTGRVTGSQMLDSAIGCDGGALFVLDRRGEEIWRASFEPGRTGKGNVLATAIGDFDGDGKGEVIAGLDNSQQIGLDDDGKRRWRFGARHSTTVLEVADVDRNGCDDLAICCTYGERLMVYFSKSGKYQQRSFGASISGGSSVTFADVAGDTKLETIYAGKDAGLRVCKPSKERYRLDFVWQKHFGSDAISRVVALETNDANPLLAIGSMDGFVALLDAEGGVEWMQYLGENVRDLDAATDGSAIWVAVDTNVVHLDRSGQVNGRRDLAGRVGHVRHVGSGRAVATEGSGLVLLSPT